MSRTASPEPAPEGPPPGAPGSTAAEPPFRWPSFRATVGTVALLVLLGGIAYPAATGGFAAVVSPLPAAGAPPGTLNATEYASEILGQNISNDSLFWLRPSLLDWQAALGSGENPYGPTDPALVNATEAYIALYGLNGTTAPLDLVSPSESGLDPDLVPAAALAQVPRVAAATHLPVSQLMTLVESHIEAPLLGFLGTPYVNVIDLDRALLGEIAGGA